ncbi:DUF1918 domain-containing protein [Kribbella sp. NPDC048915]|uniref:DUF1918 domain-containing protein n=1 Tax=Kribbella sp. NPDC048915 TaxID=3155148 RepID=UPI0033FFFE6E
MYAQVGDHIHVHGHKVGCPVRDGTIIEVRGSNGTPPYLVRWVGLQNPALVYPGPDAQVVQFPPAGTRRDRLYGW